MSRVQPKNRAAWRAWLEANHASEREVFVVFVKKSVGRPTITYADAVEEALCFGWIDGRKSTLDDERYTHRFTPRQPGSTWSATNKARIAALDAAGKLHRAGRAAIAAARADGSWKRAPNNAVPAAIPRELATALRGSPRAKATYDALAPSHQRQWQQWIHAAKQAATRARRAAKAVAQLAAGGKKPAA
jgi:uncharacterized protein YdeI (YjbR/CyaY-like superfamily)